MPDRTELWSCIACGAIGTPADLCTGACDDRRAVFVRAFEHDALVATATALEAWHAEAGRLVARIAAPSGDTPAERAWGDWQRQARVLLARRPRDLEPPATGSVETVEMWHCATCGRTEAPQPCLGVCVHRPEAFVRADVHEAAVTRAVRDLAEVAPVAALLTRLARTTPRPGGWDASVGGLREQARAALG